MSLNLKDIIRWLSIKMSSPEIPVTGVSIDSRTLLPGELFVALPGQHVDGHQYIDQAFQRGACAALISSANTQTSKSDPSRLLLTVKDPLVSLKELARHRRNCFKGPVIAITGTNGKTTTREMIADILSRKFSVHKTESNLNNHIGVPLSILGCPDNAEIMVLEMGMNHHGEINELCMIAEPTHGVITNVGRGHLAFFRNVADVAKAKAELLISLKNKGFAFLNGDDIHLKPYHRIVEKTILFGFGDKCHVRATIIHNESHPSMRLGETQITLRVLGEHQLTNALAAVAVGQVMQVPMPDMKEALEAFQPFHQRMEIIEADDIYILNDVYNANPDSMLAALKTLMGLKRMGRHVAILGDMLELGIFSGEEHTRLGEWIGKHGIDLLLGVGTGMSDTVKTASAEGNLKTGLYSTSMELVSELDTVIQSGDTILVKGSRAMHMELVIDALKQLYYQIIQ